MKLDESLKRVDKLWHKACLRLVKPLSEKEIIGKLASLKIPISKDVIKVYSTLGGMKDCKSDSTLLSFWEIDKILAENKSHSGLIDFADFLIYSHLYSFKFENEFVSSIHIWWSEKEVENIAGSFEEFFENYLTNPEKFYLFEREQLRKA